MQWRVTDAKRECRKARQQKQHVAKQALLYECFCLHRALYEKDYQLQHANQRIAELQHTREQVKSLDTPRLELRDLGRQAGLVEERPIDEESSECVEDSELQTDSERLTDCQYYYIGDSVDEQVAGGKQRFPTLRDTGDLVRQLCETLKHFCEDKLGVASTCDGNEDESLPQLMAVGSSVRAISDLESFEGTVVSAGDRGVVMNVHATCEKAMVQFKHAGCVRIADSALINLEVCGSHLDFLDLMDLIPRLSELHAAMASFLPGAGRQVEQQGIT